MHKKPIPTYQFGTKYLADIPFQIIRFEELPQLATKPIPHRRTFYEIFWISEGQGIHHIDFEAWTITDNALHFTAPGQVSLWQIEQAVRGYAIFFMPDFLATNLFEKLTLQSIKFFRYIAQQPLVSIYEDVAITSFVNICEQMLSEYNTDQYGRFTLLQSYLTTLLIHAQRQYVAHNQEALNIVTDDIISTYRQLIDTHFYEVKSIQDYAQMLNITSGYLRDMTREKLGVTPSHLLNKRIILEAKRLLTYSQKTVVEIAQALNFDDPSYFSRFFKRETGISPTAFRQHILEKYQHPHA